MNRWLDRIASLRSHMLVMFAGTFCRRVYDSFLAVLSEELLHQEHGLEESLHQDPNPQKCVEIFSRFLVVYIARAFQIEKIESHLVDKIFCQWAVSQSAEVEVGDVFLPDLHISIAHHLFHDRVLESFHAKSIRHNISVGKWLIAIFRLMYFVQVNPLDEYLKAVCIIVYKNNLVCHALQESLFEASVEERALAT